MPTTKAPRAWAPFHGFARPAAPLAPAPRTRTLVLTLLTAFVAALGVDPLEASPQRRKRKGKAVRIVYFEGSLDEARKQGHERNVPVLIHAVLDGEEAGDRYRETILPDGELRRASQGAIVICANDGVHESKTLRETVDGREEERTVCERYGTSNCSAHQKNWNLLYHEFRDEESGDWALPMTVVLSPDGERAFTNPQPGEPPDAAAVRKALEKVRKKFGPGLSKKQLLDAKNALERSDTARRAGNLGDAWRKVSEVSAFATHGKYGKKVREDLAATEAAMQGLLDEIEKRLVPGTAKAAFAELLELEVDWDELPQEKALAAVMKRAGKQKAIRPEIKLARLERDAEALWQQAQALERSGEERKAQRLIKQLLRDKFAETPAARRAREAYPELVPPAEGEGAPAPPGR